MARRCVFWTYQHQHPRKDSTERGAYLCLATGPMQLNLAQRRPAIKLGYALSQISLLDAETTQQLDNRTEEDIYELITWPWLTPEQRQRWADAPKEA